MIYCRVKEWTAYNWLHGAKFCLRS